MSDVTLGWWWIRTLEGFSIVLVAPWGEDWEFVREQEDPTSTLAVWSVGQDRPHALATAEFVGRIDEPSDLQPGPA